jgi:hypothetical protein
MIEVIKSGNSNKSKTIVTKCPKCGCVFSFIDDCSYYGGDLCHSRPLCEDYVYCPECEEKIVVHDTSCYADTDAILCDVLKPNKNGEYDEDDDDDDDYCIDYHGGY